jgi:hypothetical protein
VLEIATPWGVPFAKSSYFDCSQVRVPSAETRDDEMRINRLAETVRKKAERRENIMDCDLRVEKLRVSRGWTGLPSRDECTVPAIHISAVKG